jgi:hypothetical protein
MYGGQQQPEFAAVSDATRLNNSPLPAQVDQPQQQVVASLFSWQVAEVANPAFSRCVCLQGLNWSLTHPPPPPVDVAAAATGRASPSGGEHHFNSLVFRLGHSPPCRCGSRSSRSNRLCKPLRWEHHFNSLGCDYYTHPPPPP